MLFIGELTGKPILILVYWSMMHISSIIFYALSNDKHYIVIINILMLFIGEPTGKPILILVYWSMMHISSIIF